MRGLIAASSSMAEIERAPALAIDFGEPEDRGREERGDIGSISSMIKANLGDCLRTRIIRKVVREDSPWGEIGKAVETTQRDEEIRRSLPPRTISHWYFSEGVSPAIIVLEFHPTQIIPEGVTVIDPSGKEIEQSSVYRAFDETMGPIVTMMLFSGSFPIAALEETGMSPEEIVDFMKKERIGCMEGYTFG